MSQLSVRAWRGEVAAGMQTPGAWGPGAVPTVDFLLSRLGAIVKKMGVKSL